MCHHLALVRHRHYGADLELRLNRLVLRGHQQLYHHSSVDAAGIFAFASSGFPRLVRREKRLVGLSALLFGVPLLLMTLLIPRHPEIAFSIMAPATVEQMGQQFSPGGSLEAGRPVDSDVLMFGYYIRNNIGIAFRTFAGGILGGVGSIFFLVYNGLAIGAVTGYVRQMGFGPQFFPFAIGHGAFELTAIVLAGAAGLRLGLALLAPGSLSRGRACSSPGGPPSASSTALPGCSSSPPSWRLSGRPCRNRRRPVRHRRHPLADRFRLSHLRRTPRWTLSASRR